MNGMFLGLCAGACLLALAACAARAGQQPGDMTLWYDRPASKWTEAMPVGNGSMGAMVFGSAPVERIQFNEDTLWIGQPRDYSHPGAAEHLPEIRKLLHHDTPCQPNRARDAQRPVAGFEM